MILITGLTGTSGSSFYKVLCRENFREKIRVLVESLSQPEVNEFFQTNYGATVNYLFKSYLTE